LLQWTLYHNNWSDCSSHNFKPLLHWPCLHVCFLCLFLPVALLNLHISLHNLQHITSDKSPQAENCKLYSWYGGWNFLTLLIIQKLLLNLNLFQGGHFSGMVINFSWCLSLNLTHVQNRQNMQFYWIFQETFLKVIYLMNCMSFLAVYVTFWSLILHCSVLAGM